MDNLLQQAKQLGAVINSGGLCLPARALVQFLSGATSRGFRIRYVECLYFHEAAGAEPKGTQPHLEYSRDFLSGQSVGEFISEAGQLSRGAIEYAAKHNVRPYFQIGLDPDLETSESGVPVRR